MDPAALITKILFILINAYNSANSLASRIFGYSPRDGFFKNKNEGDFCHSAHRFRILLRHDIGIQDANVTFTDENFALLHTKWENPVSAILDDERATLCGLTNTHALFVVVKENRIDVYDPAVGPFVFRNQLELAHELVTIPLRHFVALSHMVPDLDPNVKTLLLSNTGRCGSTLLSRILEQLDGRVLSMSEPDAYTHINQRGKSMTEPLDDLLRASFRLQVNKKGTVKEGVRLVVIKLRGPSMGLIPDVARAAPDILHAFLYRNPRGNIASTITMFRTFFKTMDLKLSSNLRRTFLTRMEPVMIEGMKNEKALREVIAYVERNLTEIGFVAIFWALKINCILECKRRGVDLMLLTYDELVSNPAETMLRLLEHCGLVPPPPLEKALATLGEDSQDGTPLSRELVKKVKMSARFTQEQEQEVQDIFTKCGLPPLDDWEQIFQ